MTLFCAVPASPRPDPASLVTLGILFLFVGLFIWASHRAGKVRW
jgi:hypothetical protein